MAKQMVLSFLLVFTLARSSLAWRKLLVFLIDGMRHDYISDEALESLPGFREIVNRGVKVDYLTPDFPSLSYPNYYTLMTGRHCEVHQMIGNYMWDPTTNTSFDIGVNQESLLPLWWNGSEPLWVTMMKAKRKVFMYYWPAFRLLAWKKKNNGTAGGIEHNPNNVYSEVSPIVFNGSYSQESVFRIAAIENQSSMYTKPGCEVEILGIRPTFCQPYFSVPSDANFSNAVDNAIESLRSGKTDMAAVYYERIDVEGHHYGPLSNQRKNALKAVDDVILRMTKLIKDKGLQKDLNIVLFSDHGMTDIYWMDKVIELRNCINMSDVIQIKDRGPVVSLWPAKEKELEIYNKLKNVPHMTVYRRESIPSRFYYKNGRFVPPLTLVAEEGWFIVESRETLPFWENGTGKREAWQNGWHGYDNELMDMRGVFLAYGPDFKPNFKAAPIRSVDVYNVMCKIAGIEPLPNNGSWSRVECMLKNNANLALLLHWSSSVLALILLALLV